jgi:hypothetical protein
MMAATHSPVRKLAVGLAAAVFCGASELFAADAAPTVETRSATLVGINGLTVNGRIHPYGLPTRYYFEYRRVGHDSRQTKIEPLPPRLAAFYHESWEEGWNGWGTWAVTPEHFDKGGVPNGFIRYENPRGDDHNHDDGTGAVHLAKYMYPGIFNPQGNTPSAFLAAGDPDFRDARIRLSVRGNHWVPNGTELGWWSQAQSNPEINPDDGTLHSDYRHSNWAFTGYNLTELLQTGKWERADYRLTHDSNLWTYAGHNPQEVRYHYWPIDQVQRHLNFDFFHMVMFVDPANRPTGSIDFDEFEVSYRNYSLMLPSNGGMLTRAPVGSQDDPVTLTDGWRHGPGRMWQSAADHHGPLEFVYEFANPVTVQSVQIHQHPDRPSREVEVSVSEDGSTWHSVLHGELPQSSPFGPNHAFLLQRGLNAPARHAKVSIASGYQPDAWGLGEIEFFGTGAVMETDDDWYHVNADLPDLHPGQVYEYCLVAMNSAGTVRGDYQQVKLPTDATPHVLTGEASRVSGTSAKVEGRLNPLGQRTQFYFEYGPDESYGQTTNPDYGGQRTEPFFAPIITPRTVFATLTGLKPGTVYHYRLVAVNSTGTAYGADKTFQSK